MNTYQGEVKSVFMGRGAVNVEVTLKEHEPPWLPKTLTLGWPVGTVPELRVGDAVILTIQRKVEAP